MTDDQIKALAAAGGVMGIAFVPSFIHPERATIDHLAEHVCYVANLVGIEHVAIGSDYDGMGSTVPVVPDVSQLVHLTRSLLAHGLSEEEVRKVWGGNFLRLLQQTLDG
jgi:membrane dipeptidase